jgi:hypothetical protein
MNIGDTLIDTEGKRWVIFDLSESFVFAVDFETQIVGHAFGVNDSFTIEPKPDNVEYMFIKRRQANMKTLFKGV